MGEDDAWFAGVDSVAESGAVTRINDGEATVPMNWPAIAVDRGVTETTNAYYDLLHSGTLTATRKAVDEVEHADDQQLIHLVRATDDAERTMNELAERLAEWAASTRPDAGTGVEYARTLIESESVEDVDPHLLDLADTICTIADTHAEFRQTVEQRAPSVAPNLAALAGPVLAARLIALAGGLEALAKLPSGTVQVLGAEDALFAHLQGDAPSPKHGVIYTHPYVRDTPADDRGSAARAVAGKLTIAARIDHYSGDYRPGLEQDLDDRIATIRDREEDTE